MSYKISRLIRWNPLFILIRKVLLWHRKRHPIHSEKFSPKSNVDAIFEKTFGDLARKNGFEVINSRKFVRSTKVPIREMITIEPLKYHLAPMWGFSLDFVPAVQDYDTNAKGYSLWWKKTPKDSEYDLSYDPLDYSLRNIFNSWTIDKNFTEAEFYRRSQIVAQKTFKSALPFFNKVHRVEDLVKAFEQKRKHFSLKFGYGLDHYPDDVLAYAFVLNKIGKKEESRKWFKSYSYGVSEPLQKRLKEFLKNI